MAVESSSLQMQLALPERLLFIVRSMNGFTLYLYKCYIERKVEGEDEHYVFMLPEPLKNVVREAVDTFKNESLIEGLDILLGAPNRDHVLTEKIKQCFEEHGQTILRSNANYIRWCAMCLVLGAQLVEKFYIEAPIIVVNAICGITLVHDKFEAFKYFGCTLPKRRKKKKRSKTH